MATAIVDTCLICMNSFNEDFYKSVSLPCGHDFCLLCLVRLKASGKNNCPTCRSNWAGFEVPALPGMEALASTLKADQDNGDMAKKKGMFERCEKHSRHYEYWAVDIKEFYCPKCIAENPPTKLELIEDVIPQIKAAIALDVPNAKKKVENFVEALDQMHAMLVRKRNCMQEFMEAAQTIDDNFKQEIEDIVCVRSKALDTVSKLNNMDQKLNAFANTADLHLAVECQRILKKSTAPSRVHTSDLPQTLLCNIACSYVEESATAKPPCTTAFVYAVKHYGTKPSPETVRAAEQLKGGSDWLVDNYNCEAALLALADRQPSRLTLVARDDARETLPVAALARAVKSCGEVKARFLDTFYSAPNTAQDTERLRHLTANQSLRLTVFFGHLEPSNFAAIPHCITHLFLAIRCAADAAAVSGLRPWQGLSALGVSVSFRVAAGDLKPLPNVPKKYIYFPFLSDAGVDDVRPAIKALAPDLRIISLRFPKSQLTAAGALCLAQQLRGVKVEIIVTIEASGTWRPAAEEKKSLEAGLRSATGCNKVEWDMDWIYR